MMAARPAPYGDATFAGLLISVNYTANLISYLAVTTVTKPIHSIQEFLADPAWRLAAEGGLNSFQDWQVSRLRVCGGDLVSLSFVFFNSHV